MGASSPIPFACSIHSGADSVLALGSVISSSAFAPWFAARLSSQFIAASWSSADVPKLPIRSSSTPASVWGDATGFSSSLSLSFKRSLIHSSDAISSPITFSSSTFNSSAAGAIVFIQSGISAWASSTASSIAEASGSGLGLSKKEVGSASPSEFPQPAARMKSGILSSSEDVSIAEASSGSRAPSSCFNQSGSSFVPNSFLAVSPHPLANCGASPGCQSNRSRLIAASGTSSVLKTEPLIKAA